MNCRGNSWTVCQEEAGALIAPLSALTALVTARMTFVLLSCERSWLRCRNRNSCECRSFFQCCFPVLVIHALKKGFMEGLIMMMEYSIHGFYTTAKRYCRFLQEWVIDSRSAPELISLLMDLYRLAGRLPAGNAILSEEAVKDLGKTGYGEEGSFACRVKIDPDYPTVYYGQLNPFCNDQEDCQLSLAADLRDI